MCSRALYIVGWLTLLAASGCCNADRDEAVRLREELERARAEISQLKQALAAQQGEPPPAEGTNTVSGKILLEDQPLSAGTVTFHTDRGASFAAMIHEDGSYQVKSMPTGPARVTVEAPGGGRLVPGAPAVRIPKVYADVTTSPLTARIVAGNQMLDFQLKGK